MNHTMKEELNAVIYANLPAEVSKALQTRLAAVDKIEKDLEIAREELAVKEETIESLRKKVQDVNDTAAALKQAEEYLRNAVAQLTQVEVREQLCALREVHAKERVAACERLTETALKNRELRSSFMLNGSLPVMSGQYGHTSAPFNAMVDETKTEV